MGINMKMVRFLHSIGVNDLGYFDIDMISCVKSQYDGDFYTFTFVKDKGWTYEMADRFFNCLFGIKYKYRMIFTYKSPLKDKNLVDLISDRKSTRLNSSHQIISY